MVGPPLPQHESPHSVYVERLAGCRRDASQRRRQHILFGYLRLGWAVLLIALAWLVFARHQAGWPWLIVPWIGFAVTAHFHGRVLAAGARSRRAMAWYEHGLARLEDRWSGSHPRSPRSEAATSLYAGDLDLFSEGGLFELLCTARTSLGEDTLAQWLQQPAPLAEVQSRQLAVAALRARPLLREAMASFPGPDLISVDRETLLVWAEQPTAALPNALRWLAPALAVLTVLAALRWYSTQSPLLFAAAIVVDGSLTYAMGHRLQALFAGAEKAAGPLAGLADLLEILERETFPTPSPAPLAAPLLAATQAGLLAGQPASRAVRQLARLAGALALRGNPLLRPLNIPLLYGVQLGSLVQAWKARHGSRLRVWFEAIGTLEALLSLSAYSFEHPQDGFPELLEDHTLFDAAALGHPLLPAAACVRNDVRLDEGTRLLLVSGSNMSGKSTLLRSVGVAAVMALAGAPVRARHLRLGFFHVAASIQVNDSLQGGRSRFYAEILRLRAICERARHEPPVLFLLDELLAGTNSHDRVAGASGVIRELLAANASGLLSTHDLALTAITGPESRLIRNTHFEDSVVEDTLVFDYALREGVVTRSNGLALMRLMGLDV